MCYVHPGSIHGPTRVDPGSLQGLSRVHSGSIPGPFTFVLMQRHCKLYFFKHMLLNTLHYAFCKPILC